jgi:hypothetical protein
VIGFVLLPVILQILPFFLIWAAAIATVVLVVDDLLTLFEGGDSVIGRFLDEMFGIGTAARVAAFVQRAWAAFIVWIRTQAIPFIQRLGRELVALWPRVRPVLRAIGRGLVRAFRFLVALPGRVQRIEIQINGTDLSAEELQRTIVGALEEQRQRALRVAERALTTVAG